MDGQQEPVRYKSHLLFGSESDSVPALFAYFLYWFRESKVDTVNNNRDGWTSADEQANQSINRYASQRTMETNQKQQL